MTAVPASSPGTAEVDLELPSEAASVARARRAAGDLARSVGAPDAILHAFRGREAGTIVLTARLDRGRLIVAVGDTGTGMRPNLESTGLGLGISLITKLAADVRFDSSDRGTTVSMSFPVNAASA